MMLRSFIAVEIPAEIQSKLASATAPLQMALPKPLIRWVAPQNVHLTLKFLGDVSPASLKKLAESLKTEVVNHETFNLTVGGFGTFPNPRRARIIWIGLITPPGLTALLHCVETVAEKLGYSSENRPFSPHLTIGRVGQNTSTANLQRIRNTLNGTVIGLLGTVHVDAVHIFKSDLQPTGPVYTCLYSLPLKQPGIN
jgi:RNA 2',3'-cyclic 3'-phosphodiesterase